MGIAAVGVIFCASLVLTGWTAVATVLTPSFLLITLPLPECIPTQRLYRRVTRLIQWAWMGHVVLLLEHLFRIQVRVYGDAATRAHEKDMSHDRAMWISNHRTRIDWMLLWSVAWRTRTLQHLRIVLKAPLRSVPVFGWAMQHFVFVFLQRHWEEDVVKLRKVLPFLTAAEPDTSYLLFPEGTDLSARNVEKSHSFADKNGFPRRQFSLYPRTTGWTFMFPLLWSQLTAVYDITMFYVDYAANERPSEQSLLSGRVPRRINFYIERIDILAVRGKSESELAAWLETRFERKEALLKTFYESDGKLPTGAETLFEESQGPAAAALVAFWIVLLLGVTTLCVLAGKLFSFLAAGLIVTGYITISAFGSGVDGYLVENCEPNAFHGANKAC